MSRIAIALFRRLQRIPNAHRVALRALRWFRPARFSTPAGEFFFTHWTMVSAAQSSDGRQLGEGNTVPQLERTPFSIDLRVGKLDGSRQGLPVNQNALQIVMRNWDVATKLIAELRSVYTSRRGLQNQPLSYLELLAFSKICTALSAYQLRRRNNPVPDGGIPVPVATIYKLVMGVHATVDAMINSGESRFDPNDVSSAEFVYEYADAHALFLSRGKVACGGPKIKVLQLLELLIDGILPSGPRKSTSDEKVFSEGELQEATSYGMNVVHMEIAVRRFQAEIASIFVSDTHKALAGSDEQMRLLEELEHAAAFGASEVQCNHAFWARRMSTLGHILSALGGQVDDDALRETENGSVRVSGHDHSSHFESALDEAVHRYQSVLLAAHVYCNGKQRAIRRCLGFTESTDISQSLIAMRLNKHVYSVLKRDRRLARMRGFPVEAKAC